MDFHKVALKSTSSGLNWNLDFCGERKTFEPHPLPGIPVSDSSPSFPSNAVPTSVAGGHYYTSKSNFLKGTTYLANTSLTVVENNNI